MCPISLFEKTVLITSARDCGKKKFLIIFLVDADQDPEQCNEERTLKPITDYDQLFQLVLWYNRFLHLLIDLLKDLVESSSSLRFPPEIERESLYP